MDLTRRSAEIEIMDDLNISGEVVDQTLRELDVINQRLGGNHISLSQFKHILKSEEIKSLVDLGCGGADILIAMHNMASKMNKDVRFEGIDANPNIVAYAQKHTESYDKINISQQNIFDPEFAHQTYDIIHCCLFLHHFTNEELTALFRQFKKQARVGIMVNDLHRHPLAYHSIKLLTRLFSKSSMVRNDAAVSVARGFSKSELIQILQDAGINNYTLKWKWAFRWSLWVPC